MVYKLIFFQNSSLALGLPIAFLMLAMDRIVFDSGEYYVEDGILFARVADKGADEFSISDANRHIRAYSRLRRSWGSIPELLDLRGFTSLMDMEIVRHFGLQSYKQRTYQGPRAYLINSLKTLVQVDLFLKISRNGYFTEIFECEKEAKNWLRNFNQQPKLSDHKNPQVSN